MVYVMQAYFGPHHFDLTMELRIRKCLSNPRIVAMSEIGLDYQT